MDRWRRRTLFCCSTSIFLYLFLLFSFFADWLRIVSYCRILCLSFFFVVVVWVSLLYDVLRGMSFLSFFCVGSPLFVNLCSSFFLYFSRCLVIGECPCATEGERSKLETGSSHEAYWCETEPSSAAVPLPALRGSWTGPYPTASPRWLAARPWGRAEAWRCERGPAG